MKKMILAATAALAMLASCNKHTDEIADSATGSVVKITLTDKTPETRAFFDQTAAAEKLYIPADNDISVPIANPDLLLGTADFYANILIHATGLHISFPYLRSSAHVILHWQNKPKLHRSHHWSEYAQGK